ncbi:proteasome inhibitor [Nesidiocoris tenuis]|uniref:Proteasome inhibitor PI31 subunit n=1 Tax=Nesidiocoris tenuis TaxID=355587 RepID=A0ABN7ABN6_9HEMI|nr:proteasome inhibitor [Nesidiocoris tenuis]
MADSFGWDLMYKVSENDLKKKEDVLTLVIHYVIIKNGFRCVGLGDDKTLAGTETTSELLPNGWNSAECYALRYSREQDLFILKGVPVDDALVYNFMRVKSLAVSTVAFNVEGTVKATNGPLETLIPSFDEIMKQIKTDLLDPLKISSSNKEVETQTATPLPPRPDHPISDPDIPRFMPPQPLHPTNPLFGSDPDRDPLRVGGRDLDPFGVGGGNIFNPFNPRGGIPDPGAGIPGGLPRGAIPPGARFDPFGPPGAGGFGGRGPRRPPDFDPGSMFL